jgi:YVTN family beta-propeller protein
MSAAWPASLLLFATAFGAASATQEALTSLRPSHIFHFPGAVPDWMTVTNDSIWIDGGPAKAVYRVDPEQNDVVQKIDLPGEPCSGLVSAFGSLWVPICKPNLALARVDVRTKRITIVPGASPGEDEGGITASPEGVWLVNQMGVLLQIDPSRNAVRATVPLPSGAFNPLYSDGLIWVTDGRTNELIVVDPNTHRVTDKIKVGPKPRFLTDGAGAIWILNQGDGSVSRVNQKSHTVESTIKAEIPGEGGEICFCGNFVWTTLFKTPLTRIDVSTNQVARQWKGTGGDSVRCAFGSVWLTHAYGGLLWRYPLEDISK